MTRGHSMTIKCSRCGCLAEKLCIYVRRSKKLGQKLFCSTRCYHASRATGLDLNKFALYQKTYKSLPHVKNRERLRHCKDNYGHYGAAAAVLFELQDFIKESAHV